MKQQYTVFRQEHNIKYETGLVCRLWPSHSRSAMILKHAPYVGDSVDSTIDSTIDSITDTYKIGGSQNLDEEVMMALQRR